MEDLLRPFATAIGTTSFFAVIVDYNNKVQKRYSE